MDYYIVDQKQAHKTLRYENCLLKFIPFAVGFLVLAVVFASLSLTVIKQYHDYTAYNETSCCCTRNIERWCRRRDDSCEATAEATSVTGQTVKLKFPSYQMFRGRLRGYNQWEQLINNETFRCYVQSSASTTAGVTSYKLDMYGWYVMASLAAVCLVTVIVYLLIVSIQQKTQRKPASALPMIVQNS